MMPARDPLGKFTSLDELLGCMLDIKDMRHLTNFVLVHC